MSLAFSVSLGAAFTHQIGAAVNDKMRDFLACKRASLSPTLPGMRLETYMKRTGTDATTLAAKIGVTREAVRKWVRGDRIPRATHMAKLVHATQGKVGPEDFYQ